MNIVWCIYDSALKVQIIEGKQSRKHKHIIIFAQLHLEVTVVIPFVFVMQIKSNSAECTNQKQIAFYTYAHLHRQTFINPLKADVEKIDYAQRSGKYTKVGLLIDI